VKSKKSWVALGLPYHTIAAREVKKKEQKLQIKTPLLFAKRFQTLKVDAQELIIKFLDLNLKPLKNEVKAPKTL
jgi:hypothetical protein